MLDGDHHSDRLSLAVNLFIVALILLNIIAVILESEQAIYDQWVTYFYWFEVFSVTIFTIEYLTRLWVCVEIPAYAHPVLGRIKYVFTPYAIIDLVAILPFYLGALVLDLRFLRMLRLIRLLRMGKLIRYMPSLQIFINALKRRRGELLIALTLMLFLLIFASSLMYFAERSAQPEKFSSIPNTMWWAVATLGKVSYGDMKPITTLGKVLAGIISIIGIGIFALPAGILGSAFIEEIRDRQEIMQKKDNSKTEH